MITLIVVICSLLYVIAYLYAWAKNWVSLEPLSFIFGFCIFALIAVVISGKNINGTPPTTLDVYRDTISTDSVVVFKKK